MSAVRGSAAPKPVRWTMATRMSMLSRIVFCLCFMAPGGVIDLGSLRGNLPPPLDESNEFLPAVFQVIWFVPALISLLRWRAGRGNRPMLIGAAILGAVSVASLLMGRAAGLPVAEAWYPMASAGVAVLAFGLIPQHEAREHLKLVMAANLLTIPLVLVTRLAGGSEFLRLNALGLNANSSGVIFALWWLLMQTNPAWAFPAARGRPRWLMSAASFVAVLISGSRTAFVIILGALVASKRLRRVSPRMLLMLAAFAIVLGATLSRSFEGENHGDNAPPAELEDSPLETFSAVGRAWSLVVGVGVLVDTWPVGTQSVQVAVESMRDNGYPTFSHSTFLMFLILYGWIGALLDLFLTWRLWNVQAPLPGRLMLIVMSIFAGGLVTNPKEIALCALMICTWPNKRRPESAPALPKTP